MHTGVFAIPGVADEFQGFPVMSQGQSPQVDQLGKHQHHGDALYQGAWAVAGLTEEICSQG